MLSEKSFDAIVIGAGPAGSTAAYLLAKSGFHVLVLDKKIFPRDKLCGGLLTRKTIRLLEAIFQTTPDWLKSSQIVSHHCFRYGVNVGAKASLRGRLDYPFHFINRTVYDAFWLEKACQAGAEFSGGEKFMVLDPSDNSVITAQGQKYNGTLIFGADGAPSRLRRLLTTSGFIKDRKKSDLATALETVVSQDQAPWLPDYPVIYFGGIRWGYAWCFPRKDDRILGICGLNEKSGRFLKRAMTRFLAMMNIAADKIGTVSSHALPYGNYLTQPGGDRILLIGDACGLADPLLGEGIYYAHQSGQLAALAAIQAGGDPQNAFRIYRKGLNEMIIPELKYAGIFRQIAFCLPGSWPGLLLTYMLKISPRICEEVIQGQRSYRWFRPNITKRA